MMGAMSEPKTLLRPRSRRSLVARAPLSMAVAFSLLFALSGAITQSAGAATPVTVTLQPTAAVYTNAMQGTVNFAGDDRLAATSAVYKTYLSFDTASLDPSMTISSATLGLSVTASKATTPGFAVQLVKASWSATKVTSNTRPAAGKVLNAPVLAVAGQRAAIALTSTADLSRTGKTSLEIIYTQPNAGVWLTRSGTGAPSLTLTLLPKTVADVGSSSGPLPYATKQLGGTKVLAHYFPPYPVSLDNKAASVDYYERNYLQPSGESGKFAAYGGLLRDRPLTRAPLTGDWQAQDALGEVKSAASAGIDGFAVDVLALSGDNWSRIVRIADAAAADGRGFVIVPQLDMSSGVGDASQASIAQAVSTLAAKSSQYRLSDGRVVLSAFMAENKSTTWWKGLFSLLRSSYGIDVAFLPVFVNSPQANIPAYAPISWAVGTWGARNPGSISSAQDLAGQAHAAGVKWMAPIAVQDSRPVGLSYREAANLATLRSSWQRAISDGADLAMLATWNDYSESTTFAPSEAHGYAFLDVSGYYSTWFKSGSAPAITGDALYLTHRKQVYDATPVLNQKLQKLVDGVAPGTAAVDTAEVQTFLVAPGTVTVTDGSKVSTFSAPAGVSSFRVPLGVGTVSATLTRGGVVAATVTSPVTVTARPAVQDLQYYAVSSRR